MDNNENNSMTIVSPIATPTAVADSSLGPVPPDQDNSYLTRRYFPEDFVFGSGTSAYQVEGAAAEGGKGLNVWDTFTTGQPGKIDDGSNGNVAVDMYHRYKEDIKTMKRMGFDSYRFSISWTRILPGGRCSAGINREGIDYYNDLIDTVLAHDMKPFVTLFHWDLPDCLDKEYHGFLSRKIVKDYLEFAELCFWEFGDRVKFWTTLNEPYNYTSGGYITGKFPPGNPAGTPDQLANKMPSHKGHHHEDPTTIEPATIRSLSKYDRSDPAKDPYTVARNLLLAHAHAVDLYRTKFKEHQEGQIGIVLSSTWFVPLNKNSHEDILAAKRATDFMLGWFLDPVLYGRYPDNMINFVPAENLAHFSQSESLMLQGSIDFLGLNYYTANFAANDPNPKPDEDAYHTDQKVHFSTDDEKGNHIGGDCGSKWLFICPWGLYDHMAYLQETYHEDLPPVYITENGVSDNINYKLTPKEASIDKTRVMFHQDHLANLLKAMKDYKELNVKGYFIWSWCDDFEWTSGYTYRFGIIYIDYMNNLTRYPKDSALWFAKFLKSKKKLLEGMKPIKLSSKRQIEHNGNNTPVKRLRAHMED